MAEIRLVDFFKYYSGSPDSPQQEEAVKMLEQDMPASLLTEKARWVRQYRETPPKPETTNPLEVEHDSQYNNPSGEGWRECFSSSCAMAAKYWGVIDDFNEYHRLRPKYGDSTDASAQVRTLQALGLQAKFVQIGSVEKLKEQIDLGRPTPVGYLHKGTGHGSGGGHYCLCIGYDDTGFWMNDPGGELDCVSGGFISTEQYAGRMVHYSYDKWVPRWSVANDHDGWGVGIMLPGKSEGGSTGSTPTTTAQPGLDLIKHFEGTRLETYICPAGIPTCCTGHTGPEVKMGQTYTASQCDQLLAQDLKRFEKAVSELITVPLNQNEFDATVSFTFNTGEGALRESTFRKRINAGEDKATCFREEFPRWVNGANGPLPGLVARRDAEVKLATS